MNDHVESSSGSAPMTESSKSVSAGSLLRSAREAEGLHIAAMAVSLKVPVSKIEALETDNLDLLPDLVFARALASSMCRALKIDPAPVLEKMPSSSAPPMKTDESGINAPFRVPGEVSSLTLWRQLSKPVVLAVVVLLVGALVLLLAPFSPTMGDMEAVTSNTVETTPSPPSVISSPDQAAGQASLTGNVVTSPAPVLSTSEVLPMSSSASVDGPANAVTPSAALDTSSPTIEGSGLATGLLVLKAKDASWVQVIDAAGVVQVRKTLVAGEVVGVSGVLPLAVVLGRADAVDVQVKGQPFDVAARTKENIARFEVR